MIDIFTSKVMKNFSLCIFSILLFYYYILFIENILEVLISQEVKVKSSYPFGSCPNLGVKINIRHYDSFRRILKTNIYDIMTHFVVY